MSKNRNILIKNVYYMLAYVFEVLKEQQYKDVGTEDFDQIYNLLGSILHKGISKQVKQGLYREYVIKNESVAGVKGKINMSKSIVHKINRERQLNCDFDDLSINNVFNQVLKATVTLLVSQSSLNRDIKYSLNIVLNYLHGVDTINVKEIPWNQLVVNRNNKNYRMLLTICYFIVDGMLLTSDTGQYKLASFIDDEKMAYLFEKFVLNYYKKHFSQLNPSASYISWNLEEASNTEYLPIMKSDITLKQKNKTMIIDTKYYSSELQKNTQFEKLTFHSSNLYQIFTYVKNKDTNHTGNVSGLLLYAKTRDSIVKDTTIIMDKNRISIKTIDLNQDFQQISSQLDSIASEINS
jgi:5-methylcytosine-specific restriction enzyme subunit McrC